MEEEREMKMSRQELIDQRVPLQCRDHCAHVLVPLNKCRVKNFYLPWHCEEERHAYEVCLYQDYEFRRKLKQNGLK